MRFVAGDRVRLWWGRDCGRVLSVTEGGWCRVRWETGGVTLQGPSSLAFA